MTMATIQATQCEWVSREYTHIGIYYTSKSSRMMMRTKSFLVRGKKEDVIVEITNVKGYKAFNPNMNKWGLLYIGKAHDKDVLLWVFSYGDCDVEEVPDV